MCLISAIQINSRHKHLSEAISQQEWFLLDDIYFYLKCKFSDCTEKKQDPPAPQQAPPPKEEPKEQPKPQEAPKNTTVNDDDKEEEEAPPAKPANATKPTGVNKIATSKITKNPPQTPVNGNKPPVKKPDGAVSKDPKVETPRIETPINQAPGAVNATVTPAKI